MKLSPRLRRWLIILASVVVVYAILGFFVAPPIARSQIETRASAALKRPVKVAKVRVNPFAMSVAVEGLAVTDHDGAELASWQRLYADFDPLVSLFRWEWRLKEVRLTQPRQRFVIAKDGALNIADLFPPPAAETASTGATTATATAEPAALPAVGIKLLRVENWEVDFTDQSHRTPFHTKAGPLTFELREFSTSPDGAGSYTFVGSTDTIERIAWAGTIAAAPVGSRGRVEFQNISLPHKMPFVEEFFGGVIQRGRVSFVVNYEVAAGKSPVVKVENTTLTIDDLGLGFRGATESAVAWQKFEVRLTAADLLARTADVARVALTGLDAHVQRTADGGIDLLAWLPPTPTPAPAPTAPSAQTPVPAPAPSVRIAEIALVDARARVTDHSTPRPGALVLDQINVTLANAGTDLDREIKLDAKARWDGAGTLAMNGVVRALPLAGKLAVQGEGLALRPLEPWIEPAAKVRVAAGTESFRGEVEFSQARGGPLALTWTGDSRVDNLDVRDGVTGGELLACQSLAYKNTHFTLDPLEISVGEIALVAPSAHVTIDEQGVPNVKAILPAAPVATADAAPLPPTAPSSPAVPTKTELAGAKTTEVLASATRQSLPFAAKIDAITIAGGTFTFADRSLPGGFATSLRDFAGSIKGLSSTELARADVDLAGSLDGVSPLRIKGSINPLANDRFSDVTVSFSNIDLPAFTPYSGRFIGKKIQKGKLRVDLDYKLSQNLLVAENRVLLDQFYLGEDVASPDALKLPIGLALALLRDREGKINLDLPIRGNLDDPDFKYGKMVMQVIGNVITKAATAPFAMLGGLFGGKEQDLSYVDFASGSPALGETATGKLAVLAKSLFERPALRLEISSPPAPAGDATGLQARRFEAMLRAARAVPSDAPLTNEETEALVRAVFAQRFPEDAAAAATATGELAAPVVPAAEPKKRGLLGRIVGAVLGRGEKPAEPTTETPPAAAPATGSAPVLTLAEMQSRLLATIALTDADFHELAAERARVIRERLLADGRVEGERVFLVTEPKVPEGASTAVDGGRVFFGLQ